MKIITVTLNPAFDIHCSCDGFAAGKENLASVTRHDAGGKGVNTSRALAAGGKESRAVVAVGRENGDTYLKQLSAAGVDFTAVPIDGRIRENITVHSSGDAETRISFAGFTADKSLLSKALTAIGETDGDTIVCFAGKNPQGIDISDIKAFIGKVKASGARVSLDSSSFEIGDIIDVGAWLIKPNEGKIFLEDNEGRVAELTDEPVYRRAQMGVGYLAQEASVFRRLSVEDNIRAVLEMTRFSKEYQAERVEALIKEFRLEKVRKSMGIQLSGGERRRTEIARAVAINPAFILLDEPFAGVDPIAVEDIQSIVATLKNKNIGVIITDHNVDETLAITDRAYLLYEGKVLKTGSPEELAADPEVRKRYLGKHFELRRSPTIDRLRQQGAEAQHSVSETDAEATHE